MQHVLTLNSGSSSIKFAVFEAVPELVECVRGQVEGLGVAPRLTTAKPGEPHIEQALSKTQACDHASALAVVLGFLEKSFDKIAIEAVGQQPRYVSHPVGSVRSALWQRSHLAAACPRPR